MSKPLFDVEDLTVRFPIENRILEAVSHVHFMIYPGETLSLVGESGSGKSTIGRSLLRLEPHAEGSILFRGHPLAALSKKELRMFRKSAQMIFQDSYSALNPRMSAQEILAEPLDIHNLESGTARKLRLRELIDLVDLQPLHLQRFPHEFSGGQRQRIGIARALAVRPEFIVCDEPVSGLDRSVQRQIIHLLQRLQQEMGLSYLFITHDLRMTQHFSDRIGVLYGGTILEIAPTQQLYLNPVHPYTKALLSAIPVPDPLIERKRKRIVLKEPDLESGVLPINRKALSRNPLFNRSSNRCVFCQRCPIAEEICFQERPQLLELSPEHRVACHFPENRLSITS
jgi:oligopeptide/dipeptide ABC transporter ATP-binding protein